MLPRINRLNKQKDFEAVFSRGKTKQDSFFVVKALPNDRELSRFGFIVSARAAKKAVARNLLRRRMSEIIRLNLKKIKNGFDVVLAAKFKLAGLGYEEMKKSLLDLLKNINIYV